MLELELIFEYPDTTSRFTIHLLERTNTIVIVEEEGFCIGSMLDIELFRLPDSRSFSFLREEKRFFSKVSM